MGHKTGPGGRLGSPKLTELQTGVASPASCGQGPPWRAWRARGSHIPPLPWTLIASPQVLLLTAEVRESSVFPRRAA